MVFLVYREGMQLPLVAMVLREASALMRTSSIFIASEASLMYELAGAILWYIYIYIYN